MEIGQEIITAPKTENATFDFMTQKEAYQMKVKATHVICWSGLGMLVVAGVPFVAIISSYSPILAGGIIGMMILLQLGALVFIWTTPFIEGWKLERKYLTEAEAERNLLRRQVAELDERLRSMETIDRVDRMIEKRTHRN